jgi:hypothetical protein
MDIGMDMNTETESDSNQWTSDSDFPSKSASKL